MSVNDTAYEANDVGFAGILIIAIFSMTIGVLIGFLIAL